MAGARSESRSSCEPPQSFVREPAKGVNFLIMRYARTKYTNGGRDLRGAWDRNS